MFGVGRMLFGSIAGALIKPLLALTIIPIVMTGFGSCTGAKHELRRANAAHHETLARIDDLAHESARLKRRADKERARADANKAWAQGLEAKARADAERDYMEKRICPPDWQLPD